MNLGDVQVLRWGEVDGLFVCRREIGTGDGVDVDHGRGHVDGGVGGVGGGGGGVDGGGDGVDADLGGGVVVVGD